MTTFDYGNVKVFQSEDGEEVPVLEIPQQLRPADIERRKEKQPVATGSIARDDQKFSTAPRKARLYRIVGPKVYEAADVPFETAQHYLAKRNAQGQPIFYARPPEGFLPLAAQSEECPVPVPGGYCGRKMLNQIELFKHIQKVHPGEAAVYMTQRQVDLALGKVQWQGGGVLKDDPRLEPEPEPEEEPRAVRRQRRPAAPQDPRRVLEAAGITGVHSGDMDEVLPDEG